MKSQTALYKDLKDGMSQSDTGVQSRSVSQDETSHHLYSFINKEGDFFYNDAPLNLLRTSCRRWQNLKVEMSHSDRVKFKVKFPRGQLRPFLSFKNQDFSS